MAQWIARSTSNRKVEGSSPSVGVLELLTANKTFYFKKPKSNSQYVWMAEWSKALHLSCSLFGGVGSNPTPDILNFHTAIILINNKSNENC
jgi:hypothetical protein